MSSQASTAFQSYLEKFSEHDWQAAIDSILPSIHEVDRDAVQIWFRFYPLALQKFVDNAEDPAEARRSVAIQGDFGLSHRIDSSHSFLYGHRYWNLVKAAIQAELEVFEDRGVDLAQEIVEIAAMVAKKAEANDSLLLGITAVGLMTLAQVGPQGFNAGAGEALKPTGLLAKSPDTIVATRSKDDSQGLLGFLKTVDKTFSVIHDERDNKRFDIVNDQELASASANDRSEEWQTRDPRCWEGPIPVECTSASCGTCWVGVIAGREKLSGVERRERRALQVFGYSQTEDAQPLIRLACQAKAHGNVTITIPPWNAVFGKKVYGNVEELELEPVTTSAKALRDLVKGAPE